MQATERAVDDRPEVVEARETREEAERARDAAAAALTDAEDALDRAEEAEIEGQATDEDRAELVARIPKLRSDLRIAQKRLDRALEEERAIVESAVAELLDEMKEEYAEAVHELHERVHDAADVNDRVRRIHKRASELYGHFGGAGRVTPFPDLSRPELIREGTVIQGQTKIGAWESFIERDVPWIELNGRRAEC